MCVWLLCWVVYIATVVDMSRRRTWLLMEAWNSHKFKIQQQQIGRQRVATTDNVFATINFDLASKLVSFYAQATVDENFHLQRLKTKRVQVINNHLLSIRRGIRVCPYLERVIAILVPVASARCICNRQWSVANWAHSITRWQFYQWARIAANKAD